MDTERSLELTFNGRTVNAAPLKPSQFTALQMMQVRGSEEQARKSNLRMYRIIEHAVGPDQWDDLMDDLATGDVDNGAFATLTEDLIKASVAYLTKKEEPAKPRTNIDDDVELTPEEIAAFESKIAAHRAKNSE